MGGEKFTGGVEDMENNTEQMVVDLVEETRDLVKKINEQGKKEDLEDLMQLVAESMVEVLRVDDEKRKRVKDRKIRIGKFMASFLSKSRIDGKYFGVLQDDVTAYLEGSGVIREVKEDLYELVDNDSEEEIEESSEGEGGYFKKFAKKYHKDLEGREEAHRAREKRDE